jgi:hypothetical protein
MTKAFIAVVLRTVLAAGIGGLTPACAPRASTEPPPNLPASTAAASEQDGGLPAVPLRGKGVIVPSDVKLEPGPKAATPPSSGVTNATATPNAN